MRVPVRREPPDDRPPPGFDRLRDRLLSDLERWPELLAESQRETVPQTTVCETDDAYRVEVDLPGVPPSDVSLELSHDRLVVTGRRRTSRGRADGKSGAEGLLRLELTLPPEVDDAAVTATLEHGVLTVHVPKPGRDRRRRIPVRVRDRTEPPQGD